MKKIPGHERKEKNIVGERHVPIFFFLVMMYDDEGKDCVRSMILR